MPDPVEISTGDKKAARDYFGLDPSATIIGAFGGLSSRKGIAQLVRAFAESNDGGRDQLFLAGKLSSDVREIVTSEHSHLLRAGSILLVDRWLNDTELEDGLCACDWISALYPRHIGSASIVLRAVASARPVIGSDFGWIGRTVSRFGLGPIVNVNRPNDVSQVIRRALERPLKLRRTKAIDKLLQFNSVENFQATWAARAAELTGAACNPPMPWSDVLASVDDDT